VTCAVLSAAAMRDWSGAVMPGAKVIAHWPTVESLAPPMGFVPWVKRLVSDWWQVVAIFLTSPPAPSV
jgi:hypothetical protein